MKIVARALAALLLVAPAAIAGAFPQSVYVMRHLQRPPGQDPSLSPEGAANAQTLAGWFTANPPKAIYVSTTKRARETAAPLADRLGLAPKDYDPGDSKALVARVAEEQGPVLIVGHSNTVPEIVELLGTPRPAEFADDDYGAILLVRDDGGERTLRWNRLDSPQQ